MTPKAREKRVRQLRDELASHFEKDKPDKALETVRELITLEPKEPEWRRKLGDIYRTLNKPQEELEARCVAATLYAESGFLLKGVAMCKIALSIDPNHLATQKTLAQLSSKKKPASSAVKMGRSALEAPHAVFGKPPQPAPATETDPLPPATPTSQHAEAAAVEAPALQRAETPVALQPSVAAAAPLDAARLSTVLPQRHPSAATTSQRVSPVPSVDPQDPDEIYIVELDEDGDGVSSAPPSSPPVESERSLVESALKRTPLLSDLNEATFIKLVETVQFRELSPGDVLFRQGDLADAMYAIAEGEVIATTGASQVVELARLGEGDFFGEIGLLANLPRGATITASTPTQLLRFERDLVRALELTEPEFIRILLRFVRKRLVASLVATSPLFAPFGGAGAEDLTRRFRFLEVQPHIKLVQQGRPSDGVFILLTGGAKVLRQQDSQHDTQHQGDNAEALSTLGPGDVFGEMSLLSREPAIASVITTALSFVLQLPSKEFTEIVMVHPAVLAYVSQLATEREAQNAGGREGRLSLV